MADYGFDTTDLEKLIASLSRAQAPTDEDRSAARSQALQVAGLGLLGTPKGQVWRAAGQAGMNALAAKNDYLAGIPKQRQAALQSATQAMSLQEQLRGLQDQQAFQQRLQGGLLTGGGAVPPSSIATPSAPPMGEAGGFSAPGVTPPQAPAQTPAAPPQDYYAKAMQQADALEAFAQSGQPGAQSAAKLARDTREQALKWRDENTGVETVMGPNGPMLIQRRKHGDPTQLPYQPKPDVKEVSTNTEKFFIDPLTQKRYGDPIKMGISPADEQRLALERQREARAAANENAGQVVQGEGGFYRVPKNGPAVPIPTAGGSQLQTPLPATLKEKVAQNNVTIRLTDDAIKAVTAYPKAFGPGNLVGDSVTQWTDPKGVEARSAVANLSSQKFHDRSGANITASESPRLKPFIPDATDRPAVVVQKLKGFQKEARLMNEELAGGKSIADVNTVRGGGSGGKIVRFQDLPR